MKLSSRLVLAAAAVGMTFAPIAAQANTRAGDSSTVYSAPASEPGKSRSEKGERLVAPGILIGLLGAAAVAGIVIIIADDDDNQSPGT